MPNEQQKRITGKLILAGEYTDEQLGFDMRLARLVVVMPKDELASVAHLPMYRVVTVIEIERLAEIERQNADLQMQLDASCNAEELRQVREHNAALRAENAALREALNEYVTGHTETGGRPCNCRTCERARAALDSARKGMP